MEALLKTGKTKAIGISNFSKKELDRILNECDVVPAAHQFELHPWFVRVPSSLVLLPILAAAHRPGPTLMRSFFGF